VNFARKDGCVTENQDTARMRARLPADATGRITCSGRANAVKGAYPSNLRGIKQEERSLAYDSVGDNRARLLQCLYPAWAECGSSRAKSFRIVGHGFSEWP